MRNLSGLTVDELWILHEQVRSVLSAKWTPERLELDRRLAQLRGRSQKKQRRPYPKVAAKYLNPDRPERHLVRSWQATALGGRAAEEGEKFDDLLVSQFALN